jgi:molybdate transport system substrate-binding protein
MRVAAAITLAVAAVPIATCAATDSGGGVVTVLAAASLEEVLTEAGAGYEAAHPEASLRFSFAGSQELVAQVRNGLAADVLITADAETMTSVAERVDEPVAIAKNRLTLVTAPGNPHAITGLEDLSDSGLAVVLAAPEVPVGRYSRDVLDAAGVAVSSVSDEPSVRAVLGKIILGEADAGLVYVTDVVAAGHRVAEVPLLDEHNVDATYLGAVLVESGNSAQAAEFLRWLGSPEVIDLLERAGFRMP